MTHPHPAPEDRLPALPASGRRLRGAFDAPASPAIVERVAGAGVDFVVPDNAHGSAGSEATAPLVRARAAAAVRGCAVLPASNEAEGRRCAGRAPRGFAGNAAGIVTRAFAHAAGAGRCGGASTTGC